MESAGVGSVWQVTAASLGVDQSPSSLPKPKALGSEVFSVASYREERGKDMLLFPQATPLASTMDTPPPAPGHGDPSLLQHPLPPVLRSLLAWQVSHFPGH